VNNRVLIIISRIDGDKINCAEILYDGGMTSLPILIRHVTPIIRIINLDDAVSMIQNQSIHINTHKVTSYSVEQLSRDHVNRLEKFIYRQTGHAVQFVHQYHSGISSPDDRVMAGAMTSWIHEDVRAKERDRRVQEKYNEARERMDREMYMHNPIRSYTSGIDPDEQRYIDAVMKRPLRPSDAFVKPSKFKVTVDKEVKNLKF
jgi:hypothetical protein